MNAPKNRPGLISLVLIIPALFFTTAGILYLAFGIDAANRLLDAMLAHAVFKLLLSPVVVLGGPLVAFALDPKSRSASDTLYGVYPFFVATFLLVDWLARRSSDESR